MYLLLLVFNNRPSDDSKNGNAHMLNLLKMFIKKAISLNLLGRKETGIHLGLQV
jgi:hypothetical protein